MNGNSPRAANRARTAQIALLAFSLSVSMHAQSSQAAAPKSSPGAAPTKSLPASTRELSRGLEFHQARGQYADRAKAKHGARKTMLRRAPLCANATKCSGVPTILSICLWCGRRSVKNPPVIIYLYSFPQDTDRFKDNAWCTTVTSGGYAAVGFVSERTGHRMEHRPVKEWFVSEFRESLGASTHDVQMILNYLQSARRPRHGARGYVRLRVWWSNRYFGFCRGFKDQSCGRPEPLGGLAYMACYVQINSRRRAAEISNP